MWPREHRDLSVPVFFLFHFSAIIMCRKKAGTLKCYVVTGLMMWKEAFTFMIMFRTLSELHFLLDY